MYPLVPSKRRQIKSQPLINTFFIEFITLATVYKTILAPFYDFSQKK